MKQWTDKETKVQMRFPDGSRTLLRRYDVHLSIFPMGLGWGVLEQSHGFNVRYWRPTFAAAKRKLAGRVAHHYSRGYR